MDRPNEPIHRRNSKTYSMIIPAKTFHLMMFLFATRLMRDFSNIYAQKQ